jgi:hypothetical protein
LAIKQKDCSRLAKRHSDLDDGQPRPSMLRDARVILLRPIRTVRRTKWRLQQGSTRQAKGRAHLSDPLPTVIRRLWNKLSADDADRLVGGRRPQKRRSKPAELESGRVRCPQPVRAPPDHPLPPDASPFHLCRRKNGSWAPAPAKTLPTLGGSVGCFGRPGAHPSFAWGSNHTLSTFPSFSNFPPSQQLPNLPP